MGGINFLSSFCSLPSPSPKQANKIGIPPFFCYSTNSSEPSHSLSVATHHLTTPPPAHCGIPPYHLDTKGIGKLFSLDFRVKRSFTQSVRNLTKIPGGAANYCGNRVGTSLSLAKDYPLLGIISEHTGDQLEELAGSVCIFVKLAKGYSWRRWEATLRRQMYVYTY